MVPGSAPGGSAREADLTTSSAEQRTRTFDVVPGNRAGLHGPVAGPATGDVLKNRFVLHQCLADGSTSRLFRALDRHREAAGDPDPWVVLKVVTAPPSAGSAERDSRPLQALRREAAIARGLEHPNLPRVLGMDHDGPHTFVCMDWLEGESLAAILDSRGSRPMTRVQALHIVEGVGRALAHLHSQRITHADVKPGNILVTAQGDATLLDFGVALGPGASDLPSLRGYTPEYASPEVLAGDEPTSSDDLFSLACVAYRMLGGHRAFGAVTAREAAVDGTRPPRPEHLSPTQWRALDRALSFRRAERQPDVATFLAQLKGARDESQAITDLSAAEPDLSLTPAAEFATSLPGSRALLRPAAVLGVIAVVGVLGVVWLQQVPDTAPASPLPSLPAEPAQAEVMTSDQLPEPLAAETTAPVPADEAVSPPAAPLEQPAAAVAPPRNVMAVPLRATAPAAPDAKSARPAELAGPPVPDPAADGSSPPSPTPSLGPAPPGGALADTTAASPAVPFSSLTVRRYVEPTYPRNAAARRLPGWVDVSFTIEPSGRTRDVRVVGADPPGLFDEAALAAVRRWRFAEMEDGTGAATGPVTSQIRVRFDPR